MIETIFSPSTLFSNLFLITIILHFANSKPTASPFQKDNNGMYVLEESEKIAGYYKNAAIASSSSQCAKIGTKMLKKGGSAVDAAIATLLCDGVVSLQSAGIGGGFLMTIWDAKEQKAYFLDAREYAPAAAHETIFTIDNEKEVVRGAKAIAIPGEVAGYWEAHQRFGKLPWADLFDDTIKICEKGSEVSRYVANNLRRVKEELDEPAFLPMKSILTSSKRNNDFVDVGEKIPRKKLAETLKKIRDHGKDVFYNGEIAKNLVQEIRAAGGIITLEDFYDYKPKWKQPINTTIRDKIMYSAPTPGSGAILAFMLNILEKLIPGPNENIMWQRIAETFKWAYAKRNEMGDFIERPTYATMKSKEQCKINKKLKWVYESKAYSIITIGNNVWDKDCLMSITFRQLLDKNYANQVRQLIKDHETSNNYRHYNLTKEGQNDFGTAHTSVYAADGSAVSVTSTINHILGSLFISESTGIIMNNEMDDYGYPGIKNGFGLEPTEFNFIRNGKSYLRPMSSMAPTIILNSDKSVRLVIGSAGGTKITTGVAQGIIFNLLLNQDIKTALDRPRLHHNLWPMAVQHEPDFDNKVISFLKSIGHDIDGWLIMQNTLSAVAVNGPKNITASGDYRREGGTSGY